MIHYDLSTMSREDYHKELLKHSSSFTPNLDITILDLFDKAKELFLKSREYKKELILEGMDRYQARKQSKVEYPYRAIEDEIERLVKIKECSARKQKKTKELKEWSKGFDKFGRYKN